MRGAMSVVALSALGLAGCGGSGPSPSRVSACASQVRTVAGGPGPSIINLPASGCWRLTLRWSGRADSLDLAYAANPDA